MHEVINICVLRADGWEAIYFNGKKVVEGHSTDWPSLLFQLHGHTIGHVEKFWIKDEDECAYWDAFPQDLNKLPDVTQWLKEHYDECTF